LGTGGTNFAICTKANSQEWYTPKYILDALGEFDLDPASPKVRRFDIAKVHLTQDDDGLAQPWTGRVWLNPPYDRKTIRLWMRKMAEHSNGIALVFMRQGTRWFDEEVMPYTTGYLVLTGNLKFIPGSGQEASRSPSASVLVAYDPVGQSENNMALRNCALPGHFIDRWAHRQPRPYEVTK
jgi:hypothetical protein